MAPSSVTATPRLRSRRFDGRIVLAFLAIYVLWGATFLAIRVAVLQIPPLFTAGLRFFLAGAVLYGFVRLRGERSPSPIEWRSIAVMALFMFVVTYGLLFWAEQYVPSGITSVIEATLPIMTLILEVFVFRQQPFRWGMLGSVTLGFAGVTLLLLQRGHGSTVPLVPALAILLCTIAWSLGAVLTRSMPLPQSRSLTAGGAMLLGGLALLGLSALSGEHNPLPDIPFQASVALLYLIVGGSLVGFTAYVWLLRRMPASRVASHAYVNPVVAVALGYFVAGEEVTLRTVLASLLILLSVFLILRANAASVK
jgi:drug/metabolite transporter (DMT)-like permease